MKPEDIQASANEVISILDGVIIQLEAVGVLDDDPFETLCKTEDEVFDAMCKIKTLIQHVMHS